MILRQVRALILYLGRACVATLQRKHLGLLQRCSIAEFFLPILKRKYNFFFVFFEDAKEKCFTGVNGKCFFFFRFNHDQVVEHHTCHCKTAMRRCNQPGRPSIQQHLTMFSLHVTIQSKGKDTTKHTSAELKDKV